MNKSLLDAAVALGRTVPEVVVERFAAALSRGAVTAPVPGQVGASLVDLAEAWRAAHGPDSLAGLGWALRASARTAALDRDEERVDLVWTGPGGERFGLLRIEQCLLDLIEGAQARLLLVTFAALAVDDVREALGRAAERGVQIRVVAEHGADAGGKLSSDPLRSLLDHHLRARVDAFLWPASARARNEAGAYGTLHAKCAVADDRELLVSSANLTGHALAINIELGVRVRGGATPARVRSHFDELIRTGVLVSTP